MVTCSVPRHLSFVMWCPCFPEEMADHKTDPMWLLLMEWYPIKWSALLLLMRSLTVLLLFFSVAFSTLLLCYWGGISWKCSVIPALFYSDSRMLDHCCFSWLVSHKAFCYCCFSWVVFHKTFCYCCFSWLVSLKTFYYCCFSWLVFLPVEVAPVIIILIMMLLLCVVC